MNHFIELGESCETKNLVITIHSGSRGPGNELAKIYMNQKTRFRKEHPELPEFPFELDINSEYGKAYIKDLNYFLQYALDNRSYMMKEILQLFGMSEFDAEGLMKKAMINKTHNHAEITPEGVLHRKGATSSYAGEFGVIPGNMRDGVYIVRGLGNWDYLSSSSHGAGRKMSRKKAKENTELKDFERVMKNVVAKIDESTLDESPFAYKDFETVMEAQTGIVIDVIDKILPLVNIKG